MHQVTTVLLIGAALIACTDGGGGASATGPLLAGVVRTVDGAPVEGAIVAAAGAVGRTGPDGMFSFVATPGPQRVQIVADGHIAQAMRIRVRASAPTVLHPRLLPIAAGVRADDDGLARTPEGVLLQAQEMTWRDATDPDADPRPMIHATLLDPADADVSRLFNGSIQPSNVGPALFAPRLAVAIDFALDPTVFQQAPLDVLLPTDADPGSNQPLYRYDISQHAWIVAGQAEAAPEGYRFSVQGPGTWAVGDRFAATCVRGQVVDSDGDPVVGAFIEATGAGAVGGHATTDAAGVFVLAAGQGERLDVAAWHADLGTVEPVDFGSAGTALPPLEGDSRCVDVGEWQVARGRFEGPVVAGNCFAALPEEVRASCAAPLFDAGTCFNVDGACVAWQGEEVFKTHYRWETGATIVVDAFELDAQGEPVAAVEYFGSEDLCLDVEIPWQIVTPGEPLEPLPQLNRVPDVGDFWVTDDGPSVKVECPNGVVERIDDAVVDEFRRCLTSPALETRCLLVDAPPLEPRAERVLCQDAGDCAPGNVCCRVIPDSPSGICIGADLCAQAGGAR